MKQWKCWVFFLGALCLLMGCQKTENYIGEVPDTIEKKVYICTPPPTEPPTVAYIPVKAPLPTITATPVPTNNPIVEASPSETPKPLDISICFAGDISLADDAVTTKEWENSGREL